MRLRNDNSGAEEVTGEGILEPAELSDSSSLADKVEASADTGSLSAAEPEQSEYEEQEQPIKMAKPVKTGRTPLRMLRKVLDNPNLGFQLMVILLTLTSENVQMDRRIDGMTSTVDRIRNITDVLNKTMSSVKVAAEAPKSIRRLLE